jgi:hypothetical protein
VDVFIKRKILARWAGLSIVFARDNRFDEVYDFQDFGVDWWGFRGGTTCAVWTWVTIGSSSIDRLDEFCTFLEFGVD